MVDLTPSLQTEPPHPGGVCGSPRDGLITAAGWGLVVGIFLAPWAFGCRPYWAALTLAAWLGLVIAAWLGGSWRERRLPAVPLLCAGAASFLAIFAGLAILNPQATFDVVRESFLANPAYLPFLPGTVDAATGWTFTLEMMAYLFTIPVVADFARSASWRRDFLGAIAWSAFLVCLAGLFLKLGGWPWLANHLERRPWAQGGEIFGPFDYHGNAGTFINLGLPAAAWKAATGGGKRDVFWRCVVGVLYVSLFANSSRAALVIGLVLSPCCGWILFQGLHLSGAPRPARRWKWALSLGVPAALLVGGVWLVNHDVRPLKRLRHLTAELRQPEYPRLMQSRTAWELAQDRPLFGAGVGTYKVLVQTSRIRGYFFAPFFRPGDAFSVLANTHEDYLQTLVEWGWVGFGGWVLLVGGAFSRLWGWLRQTRFTTRTGLAVGVALSGLYLHALGDCPLQIPVLQYYAAVYLGLAWGAPAARLSAATT